MADAALSQKDLDDLLSGGLDDSFDSTPSTSSTSSDNASSSMVFSGLDELLPSDEPTPVKTASKSSSPKSSFATGSDNIDLLGNMAALKNVIIDINVELGKKVLMIKDILSLGEGSIIELDKSATEHVDILANNRPLARGEVVVVDEQFGVRITEKMDPMIMEDYQDRFMK